MVLRPFDLTSIPESELETNERARRAFLRLRPVTPSYQTAPIEEGFNWEEALADLDAGEWYLVVFRSVRRTRTSRHSPSSTTRRTPRRS